MLIVAAIWISITLNVAINVGINGASRFYRPTGACGSTVFLASSKVEIDLFLRVLDIRGIPGPEDGRRLSVDVDLSLL